jgi:hypothetical protein
VSSKKGRRGSLDNDVPNRNQSGQSTAPGKRTLTSQISRAKATSDESPEAKADKADKTEAKAEAKVGTQPEVTGAAKPDRAANKAEAKADHKAEAKTSEQASSEHGAESEVDAESDAESESEYALTEAETAADEAEARELEAWFADAQLAFAETPEVHACSSGCVHAQFNRMLETGHAGDGNMKVAPGAFEEALRKQKGAQPEGAEKPGAGGDDAKKGANPAGE